MCYMFAALAGADGGSSRCAIGGGGMAIVSFGVGVRPLIRRLVLHLWGAGGCWWRWPQWLQWHHQGGGTRLAWLTSDWAADASTCACLPCWRCRSTDSLISLGSCWGWVADAFACPAHSQPRTWGEVGGGVQWCLQVPPVDINGGTDQQGGSSGTCFAWVGSGLGSGC